MQSSLHSLPMRDARALMGEQDSGMCSVFQKSLDSAERKDSLAAPQAPRLLTFYGLSPHA